MTQLHLWWHKMPFGWTHLPNTLTVCWKSEGKSHSFPAFSDCSRTKINESLQQKFNTDFFSTATRVGWDKKKKLLLTFNLLLRCLIGKTPGISFIDTEKSYFLLDVLKMSCQCAKVSTLCTMWCWTCVTMATELLEYYVSLFHNEC